jgi:hypothetical protein
MLTHRLDFQYWPQTRSSGGQMTTELCRRSIGRDTQAANTAVRYRTQAGCGIPGRLGEKQLHDLARHSLRTNAHLILVRSALEILLKACIVTGSDLPNSRVWLRVALETCET